jgi:methyltransferase
LTWLAVGVAAVALQRLLEVRRSRRLEIRARDAGAVEHGATHYPLFVLLHASWLLGWLGEGAIRGGGLAPGSPLFLAGFLAGQVLRMAAMRALGDRWSTRILVWPDRPPVRTGIYRLFPHPNYMGVALEIACGPLVFGAWITAAVATVLNAALLLGIRIPAENRALAGDLPAVRSNRAP